MSGAVTLSGKNWGEERDTCIRVAGVPAGIGAWLQGRRWGWEGGGASGAAEYKGRRNEYLKNWLLDRFWIIEANKTEFNKYVVIALF